MPAHRRPVVAVRITDSKEQPLELSDIDADSIRFTIAAIKTDKSGETSYHNYILNQGHRQRVRLQRRDEESGSG